MFVLLPSVVVTVVLFGLFYRNRKVTYRKLRTF